MSEISSTCQKSEAKAGVRRSYQKQRLRCGELLFRLDRRRCYRVLYTAAIRPISILSISDATPLQCLADSFNVWRIFVCIVHHYCEYHCPCRKFDFFPKGTAGADGWMSLYFKYADQFSDNQQIGFGFKLHVINFQFPSQTLTKGTACLADITPLSCCARFDVVLSWSILHIMCMCLDGYAQSFSCLACCYACVAITASCMKGQALSSLVHQPDTMSSDSLGGKSPLMLCCAVYEKSQCTFSAESPGWGHQKMALIAAVNDPQGGFIIDDTIYIGISKTES